MQHADPDQLALLALGEPIDDDAGELTAHLRWCQLCQQEIDALRRTVELARETVEYRDEGLRPPEAVWSRVTEELGLAGISGLPPEAEAGDVPGVRHLPESRVDPDGGGRGQRVRTSTGRRRGLAVAGLIAAVVLGVVGTLVAVRPWQDGDKTRVTASTASLGPVVGGPGEVSGRAVLVQGADGPELDVTATGLPLQKGYYEVWVFDGRRDMVAIGVLGSDSTASFPLPPTLDLRTYHVVDISQEEYDGDQTHSAVSVLRGTLTG